MILGFGGFDESVNRLWGGAKNGERSVLGSAEGDRRAGVVGVGGPTLLPELELGVLHSLVGDSGAAEL